MKAYLHPSKTTFFWEGIISFLVTMVYWKIYHSWWIVILENIHPGAIDWKHHFLKINDWCYCVYGGFEILTISMSIWFQLWLIQVCTATLMFWDASEVDTITLPITFLNLRDNVILPISIPSSPNSLMWFCGAHVLMFRILLL